MGVGGYSLGLDAASVTHWRSPWFRPRWQGGDTAQPLCIAPVTGFAGGDAAARPMTDDAAAVTCPSCRHWLARGGLKAKRAAEVVVDFRRVD